MDATTLNTLLLVLAGPVAGSFLGLAADRLPRDESIVAPRSHCRACGTTLGPRDLVPLLSFGASRGRCRHCGAAIPPWLFYFEIAATGLAVFAAILAPTIALAWVYAGFLWLLLALAAADLMHFRLPNLLTLALFLVALLLSWLGDPPGLVAALWGAALGAASFLALRLAYQALRGREGLGLGDVKLMAGLGAALGGQMLPVMVLLAALAALASALAGVATRGTSAISAGRALPFGAALSAATGFLWLAMRLPV